MGNRTAPFVLLASLTAAYASCSAPPAPVLVPLTPGGTAYLGTTKWTCVGRWHGAAHTFQVIPPGDYQPLSLTTARYPAVGCCPPGDPGHTVT
jgi:hypothetical protein